MSKLIEQDFSVLDSTKDAVVETGLVLPFMTFATSSSKHKRKRKRGVSQDRPDRKVCDLNALFQMIKKHPQAVQTVYL